MSTMSFLRNVNIKKPEKVAALIGALEKSAQEPEREVKIDHSVREVRGEEVKKFMDKIKW